MRRCQSLRVRRQRKLKSKQMVTKKNVLISSAGRRIGLLACIRDSIARHNFDAKVVAIDSGSSAPVSFVTEHATRVPRCTDPDFLETVLGVCAEHEVGLLIPTIDTELPVYAASSEKFRELGVTICI